jgi:hypothetical protein
MAQKHEFRFAIGRPEDELTSNSWKVWTHQQSIYIACRDNMKDAKVSLHPAPVKWRWHFNKEIVLGNPIFQGRTRTVTEWDEPPPTLADGTIKAFRILFATSELAVRSDQREPKDWENVFRIAPGPPGKAVIVTLFINETDTEIRHQFEQSGHIAALDIDGRRRAHVVANLEQESGILSLIESTVLEARTRAERQGANLPSTAYGFFLGREADGCHFLFGARADRTGIIAAHLPQQNSLSTIEST